MTKPLVTFAPLALLGLATPLMAADAPTQEVADKLAFMREEEKLAHDVYLLFSEMHAGEDGGAKICARITESEQRHTDAARELLDAYGLADPAAGLAPGEFANDDLQALYTTLVNVGASGYTEALGVVIEHKDMTDIVAATELSVAHADIVQFYSNLLTGSEHHLAAFLRVLDVAEPGTASVGVKDAGSTGDEAGRHRGM